MPAEVNAPEFQLLILCCTPHVTPDLDVEIGHLAEICDWPSFQRLAKRHNVEALAFSRFESDRRAMPDDVWHQLREEYLFNARNNLMLSGELLRLHKVLGLAKLSFIPYKGPALAASAYGNIILRRSLDLDLLLPAEELLPAVEALCGNGYSLLDDWITRVPSEMLKYRGEYQLRKGEILLELQWRLAPGYYGLDFDIAAMAGRMKPAPLAGELIPMLAPEDHLLLLCAHGWKELWSRLSWVTDVAHLLATYPSLDWDAVLTRAMEARVRRITLVGANLAAALFQSRLPDTVTNELLKDPEVVRLTEQAIARLKSRVEHRADAKELLRYRENVVEKFRFYWGLALHPTENEWSQTKSSSELVHRIVRLKRITAKFFRPAS
jgi:hypothetical protein